MMMTGKVYFVECLGRIKVGYSTNVQERIECLSTGAPAKLVLIAAIDGNYRLEKAIHRHLKPHLIKGEWFADCAAVRMVIDALVAVGPTAIGFVPQDPTTRRAPSGVQIAITSVIKRQRPYGTKPHELLSELTGLGERSAKHRLSNTRSYSVEEARALLRTNHGFEFLKAIMGDARPEWWKPLRGRRPPRSVNRIDAKIHDHGFDPPQG